MDQHEEIWLVQFNTGAVRAMTLDELDAAFQDGTIDEDTFVRRDGSSKWSRLRDELGAEEPVAAAPVAPTPSFTPPPVAYQTYYSTRPVVSEIDTGELDLDASPFKKSRKGTYAAIGALALAAVAVAAFGATKLKGSAASVDVNASVVNAVQPQVTPPPPVDPQPVVQQVKLSDDQKKALADKDTQLNQKIDLRKKERAKYTPPATKKTSAPPFHKGGNAYDPLNAKL